MGKMGLGRGRNIALAGAALATIMGLAVAAGAQSPAMTPSPAPAPPARPIGYLPPEQLPDSLTIVGPPPAADSPLAASDRAAFEATRAMEGSDRWRTAKDDAELFGPVAHKSFACAIGKAITPEATPVLSRLLDRLVIDAGRSTAAAKDRYNRTRPMIGNDKAICVVREDWMKTNGSYPSGHAAAGWAWGLVLAELAPDRASAVVTRARDFGDSRWICGVHFQSDVEAGRTMGAATVARLHADAAFEADMATAKAELAKAPAAAGCPG
jgi:acid phosphatase (class A)